MANPAALHEQDRKHLLHPLHNPAALKGMTIAEPDDPKAWAAKMTPLWEEMASKRPGAAALIKLLDETK